ncbi:MAG: ISNCY family transposase [Candidatus Sulfotelmatobacter sp.]
MRRQQRDFGDGFIHEAVDELWEDWMRNADLILTDEELLEIVHRALQQRHPRSRTHGRPGTPAEVVLRMLLLKHIRDWSFVELEREVRSNLVYREFTRVGAAKVPDGKTMGRLAQALPPEVIEKLHARIVSMAQDRGVVSGKRMRVDTTVVETNIHYPTDSSLLGDGVRVLTRLMKRVTQIAADTGTSLRDRTRSVQRRLIEIGRATRGKGTAATEKVKTAYRKLVEATGRVVGQAKKFSSEIAQHVKRAAEVPQQAKLEALGRQLDDVLPRVRQVMRQTRARLFGGNTRMEGKLVSIFEPETEIIRKGKASKPTEFGKMVKIQEAENQIVIAYQVYEQRSDDKALLVPAVQIHQQRLGRLPVIVAADAGFYSAQGEAKLQDSGVKRISIPNHSTKSADRRKYQKQRWFRKGQKWRVGCEGRISVLKRRHGLRRCRYKGTTGMNKWVGLGVIADNLINIGGSVLS